MASSWRWRLPWEMGLLAALVAAIYLPRLTDLNLRGEEPRRGQVAREMLLSGDFLVPREQGVPFLSRPPLQNWLIAAAALVRGQTDSVAVRLPSVIALLLTVWLVYGYSRTLLSRFGALAAAIAFATMGHVLQLGWTGETEAIYTLLVSGSLLIWHWADIRARAPAWGWIAGYFLAALGMLTKGPQAPVCFAAGVGCYLLTTRRWRLLLGWQHMVGVAVFLLVVGAWQVPFLCSVGSQESWRMAVGDVGKRFEGADWLLFFKHLLVYPLEVAGCLLPWSVLLLAYLRRDFRSSLVAGAESGVAERRVAVRAEPGWLGLSEAVPQRERAEPAASWGTASLSPSHPAEHIRFLTCCLVVAFLPCWLAPGARARYFMPLYPCIAPLIGLVIERCCHPQVSSLTSAWRRLLAGLALAMPATGVWVLAATVLHWGPSFGQQPLDFAVAYFVASVLLGGVVLWSRNGSRPLRCTAGLVSIAAFLGLSYMGAALNVLIERSQPIEVQMAELKSRLPEGAHLVSIGTADCRFAWYYGDPIRRLCDKNARPPQGDWTYFCMRQDRGLPQCDFPYETIAVVPLQRNRGPNPTETVLVGRRVSDRLASLTRRACEELPNPKHQVPNKSE